MRCKSQKPHKLKFGDVLISEIDKAYISGGYEKVNVPSLSAERLRQKMPKTRKVLQISDLWDFFVYPRFI